MVYCARFKSNPGKVRVKMNSITRRVAVALLCCLCLGALPSALAGGTAPLPVDDSGGLPVNEARYLSEWEYEDPSIHVTVEKTQWEKSDCYVARITIADPSQLRTASAYGFDRKQVAAVLDMANRVNAVLAINGDYCYYQLSTKGSYLIRQGRLYSERLIENRDMLLIDDKGDFHIMQAGTLEKLREYEGLNIVNTFNFGPGLVVNGEQLDPYYRAMFNRTQERHQRAGIGQVKSGSLEYICAVSEGSHESRGGGLTLHEWAAFWKSLGVENAYNLDGGNSTGLIFHNRKLNAVKNNSHRKLSDIIYFASAYQE